MMKHIKYHSGFALIASLVILVTLTLIAVVGLRSSMVEEMTSGNQKMAASALFGAEHGVSQALEGLLAGTIHDTGSESNINWSAGSSLTGTGYSSTFTVSHLLAGGSAVEDDDGRRYFLINSTGATTTGEARRMLEVAIALEWGASSNVAGLIGCQGITGASNIITGSYSSSGQPSDGDRGDMATTDAQAFLYLDGSSDMDIVGEVRSTGAIYMKSDALVRRDALANLRIQVDGGDIYGSAYTNTTYSGSTSRVHGSIYQGSSVVPNPLVPFEPPCDPLNVDNIISTASSIRTANHNAELGMTAGGNFSNSRNTIGVAGAAKDYWYTNFTVSGSYVLTIQGDVRLYLTGNFLMDSNPQLLLGSGASLKIYMDPSSPTNGGNGKFELKSNSRANVGGQALDLQVYSKAVDTVKDDKNWTNNEPDVWDDGNQKVRLDSNSIFYGMIYAPRAHVWMDSNVQVNGSVRGRFVDTKSNLTFNYDEDLDTLYTGSPTDYKLVYWTEEYPE